MAIFQNFPLCESETSPKITKPKELDWRANTLVVGMFGTGTFSFTIEGRVSEKADFSTLTAVNMDGFAVLNDISAKGIYSIGVAGLYDVRANIKTLSGGDLTISCKVTN